MARPPRMFPVRSLAAAIVSALTVVVLGPACAWNPDTARPTEDSAAPTDAPAEAPAAAGSATPTPAGPPADLLRRPIVWNAEREALTQAYLAHHTSIELSGDPHQDSHMTPRVIVVHWTAGPTARSARATFLAPRQAHSKRRARWNLLNLSSHFVVERDGTPLQLMETDRVGRHTIGLNHLSVGIENVGDRRTWPLTRSQVEANAALVRWLVATHPTITHLIGHYEYRNFEGHPYFDDRTRFRTGRADPGRPFMQALRHEVADLGLAGAPE